MCPIALLLVACGAGPLGDGGAQGGSKGGEFSDPEIEDRCRESIELSVSATEQRCECLVAAGDYPDQATCLAERAAPATDLDCLCSTYARYPASSDFIDCFLPRQQAYADCLADAMCEQTRLDACAAMDGEPRCVPPAEAADEVAAMCTPP